LKLAATSTKFSPVNMPDDLDELMICRLDTARKAVEPCSIVILGASGDLTARKLIPALYHLFKEQQLPPAFRIVGFARREKSDDSWRVELREALGQFTRAQPVDEAVWRDFAARIFYCPGDLTDPDSHVRLRQTLEAFGQPELRRHLLFYLAVSPSQFGPAAEQLRQAGLLDREGGPGWQRVRVIDWEQPANNDFLLVSQFSVTGALYTCRPDSVGFVNPDCCRGWWSSS